MSSKKIGNLTEKQLCDLISISLKKNRIIIGGIEIESSNANLKELEQIANRLLQKYEGFLLMRKEILAKWGMRE